MATVRLFAAARDAAGRGRDELPGETVADILAAAVERYGPRFADVLATCRIWLNGDDVPEHTPVGPDDEVAVLPPVSGGAGPEPGRVSPDRAPFDARPTPCQTTWEIRRP